MSAELRLPQVWYFAYLWFWPWCGVLAGENVPEEKDVTDLRIELLAGNWFRKPREH